MRRVIPLFLLILALVCAGIAGPMAWGKLALRVGLPEVSLSFLEAPVLRGVALYKSGQYEAADAAFEAVGRSATFNRGNALAARGEIPLAVAYFDAVLFANPKDEDAQANRTYLAQFVDPVVGEANAKGSLPVSSYETDGLNLPTEVKERVVKIRQASKRQVDSQFTKASDAWLATLSDAPGEYLRKRLAAEFERRVHLGLADAEEAPKW
ncbi:MAG: hypothetical protein K9H25_06735 [Rhodospirillum sp.]|nr:hypothetical protein [Rhodospirillum sp.]MCF8487703.1 hypothetical protein [Rhodospirillum sp.]MCF8499599.1 hypothetical protein [Rhodospirillum sp.]